MIAAINHTDLWRLEPEEHVVELGQHLLLLLDDLILVLLPSVILTIRPDEPDV
jgi:hypothetical protein